MRRWILVILAGLFILSVVILLLFFRDAQSGTLKLEAAKALLQLGVVAVIGAVVSLLVFEYQRERQAIDRTADLERQALEKQRDLDRKNLEYREALLLSILSKAMDAYGRAKKARRLLRARAISAKNEETVVLADQYDACFDMLNDAQLDLENLARDVETSGRAFTDPNALVNHLRDMDGYLGKLISEFEDSRRRFFGDEASLSLTELPILADFLKPTKTSRFMAGMVVPYHEVQKRIRAALLHPNLMEPTRTPNMALQGTCDSGASLAAACT
jgi:hypothetical protein